MVGRTLTMCGAMAARVNIQVMQYAQKKCCASGPCSPPITGSPLVTSNASARNIAVRENALDDMR